MTDHGKTAGRRSTWLAWLGPLIVVLWILEPRVATNRPSYGVREAMILGTAALAIPCAHAIGRRRAGHGSARQWLWSAVAVFAALPVTLVVAGHVAPVSGSYPDDQIPGLTAGLLSTVAAVVLAVAGVVWMLLRRAGNRSQGD